MAEDRRLRTGPLAGLTQGAADLVSAAQRYGGDWGGSLGRQIQEAAGQAAKAYQNGQRLQGQSAQISGRADPREIPIANPQSPGSHPAQGFNPLDIAGKFWNGPNTILGLTAALPSYIAGHVAGTHPYFSVGDDALQLHNSPLNIDHRAYTLGNVQIYPPGLGPDGRGRSYTGVDVRTGAHEAGRSRQGEILGPFYLPAEIVGSLRGDRNPLEVGADKFATGRSRTGL